MHPRESWTFGMVPSHAIGAMKSRLNELCAIASEATGASLTPRQATSYRNLADGIRHGDVGIAWMPPIPALELEEDNAATPIVLPWRQESTSYCAALVTREARDGKPRGTKLAELQGTRVAWVDKDSAAGYLVPRMHLASIGFDPRTFFSQETFARSHLGVIEAVASGAAEIGATFCTLDPATKRVVTAGWTSADGSKIRNVEPLVTIGPIPNDAIVASARVPASVRSGLARWLLGPDERTKTLLQELFQVRSFRVASSAHFDELRHMLRAARARGYDG